MNFETKDVKVKIKPCPLCGNQVSLSIPHDKILFRCKQCNMNFEYVSKAERNFSNDTSLSGIIRAIDTWNSRVEQN